MIRSLKFASSRVLHSNIGAASVILRDGDETVHGTGEPLCSIQARVRRGDGEGLQPTL